MTRSTRFDRLVTSAIMVSPLALALFYAPVPVIGTFGQDTDTRCETELVAEPVIPSVESQVPAPPAPEAETPPASNPILSQPAEPDAELADFATPAADFLFVLDGAVLLDHDADASWGKGRVRSRETKVSTQWWKPARRKVLTADVRREVTAKYELYSAEGPVCQGTISELRVVTRATGDISMLGDDLHETSRGFKNQAFAAGPWTLDGLIEADSGNCEGALWARRMEGDASALVYTSKVLREGDVYSRAQEAFAKLEPLHALAQAYAEVYAEEIASGDVEAFADHVANRLEVRTWSDPSARRRYVTVTFGIPGETECGALPSGHAALFAVDGEAWSVVNGDLRLDPAALLDRGNDGVLEIVGGRYASIDRTLYIQEPDGSFLDLESVTVPFVGCPC
ncbi:MAG: hypothetical protein ACPG77_04745 [Nannocystaceae bacterium]